MIRFFCTSLYAFNDAIGRFDAWRDLISLTTKCKGPLWFILGDFNCVMSSDDMIWLN